ncbi:class I SAM-dependent methyltransferase [Chloroflexales bacterium ZM16-3]|nr:class I SAM-dependent methyltransferase [Chloroflexales bacterium ZM16-3]
MSGVRAGGQDWLAIWRRMYEEERAQGEAATDPEFGRHADPWAGRAGRFAAASQRQPQPDSFMRALLPRLRPDDTVLDIGAGTGRYLPVLAAAVREVIAIEPSAAMRGEMEQLIAAEGLRNVRVLAERWPPERPISGDVVISAHVVYGVAEVGPFFTAMDHAARRSCHLYLGLRHPGYALTAFWERVHGTPRLPLPAAIEALACLHQLGIYASLELLAIPGSFRFTDMGDAVDEIRHRLRLTPQPERDARIAAAAADLLVPREDGLLSLRAQPTHAAMISWAPATKP